MDLYSRVRHAVMMQGMSGREASRVFGIDPRTVAKMLVFSVPPGYRRSQPVRRPKLDPFVGVIDAILEADKQVPKKQKHTSKRVFERLRDEHGYSGGITIVKDYIFAAKRRQRETCALCPSDRSARVIDMCHGFNALTAQAEAVLAFGKPARNVHCSMADHHLPARRICNCPTRLGYPQSIGRCCFALCAPKIHL